MRFKYERIDSGMITVFLGKDYIGELLESHLVPGYWIAEGNLLGYLSANPRLKWLDVQQSLPGWKRTLRETRKNWRQA